MPREIKYVSRIPGDPSPKGGVRMTVAGVSFNDAFHLKPISISLYPPYTLGMLSRGGFPRVFQRGRPESQHLVFSFLGYTNSEAAIATLMEHVGLLTAGFRKVFIDAAKDRKSTRLNSSH